MNVVGMVKIFFIVHQSKSTKFTSAQAKKNFKY